MIAIFLGAGFSYQGGVPLAANLFENKPEVDRISRQRLVERVLSGWENWRSLHGGQPEEYLSYLQEQGGRKWLDAVWYVGLAIALRMGKVQYVGLNPTITKHNIDRTTRIQAHESFWTVIFKHTHDVGVITTNYDILAERGIRNLPRPRACRPGFNYGNGPEDLAGGGYPSYAHIQKISISGSVPIIKLHGSISWSFRNGELVHYHDCRPAIRGDAAIVAPVTQKALPNYLEDVWAKAANLLSASNTWIIVGYSLPKYDLLVRDLLYAHSGHKPEIHIFDPDPGVAEKYVSLLPRTSVRTHEGLPDGLDNLRAVMSKTNSNKIMVRDTKA